MVFDRDEILNHLRKLGNVRDEKTFETALDAFQMSDTWKRNIKLQNYVQRIWLPHKRVIHF